MAGEVGCERHVLFAAELQQQVAAGPKEPRHVSSDAAHDTESVVATIEGAHRFVTLHVRREQHRDPRSGRTAPPP